MARIRKPYAFGYISIKDLEKQSPQELIAHFKSKYHDTIYVNSSFVGTSLSKKAIQAAQAAQKRIAFVSLDKMRQK